ncbi:MAG: hypothetical protein HYZ44_18055, partial [Bacteroidetes bacterium]|nr:hypothetical protein [Bacteroidota bacterium]
AACMPSTKTKARYREIGERNKDVLILAVLIQEHLIRNRFAEINLSTIHKLDTANRITANFEKIKMEYGSGYIIYHYKFSAARIKKDILLNDREQQIFEWMRWSEEELFKEYDGEIRMGYPERFYHLKRIVVRKP